MTRSHWPASTLAAMKSFLAHGVLELLVEHAIDLHALEADCFHLDRGEDVFAEVLVGAAGDDHSTASTGFTALAFRFRELDDLIVVVVFLEVFAVGEEVEELVGGLLRLLHALL